MRATTLFWTAAFVAGALATGAAQAANRSSASWPGLWGPSRNGEATASPSAPALKELWRLPVAGGYSEIAVAGDAAVTMELRGGADFVVARDAASGRERWAVRVAPTYKAGEQVVLLGQADTPSTATTTGAADRDAQPKEPPSK